MNKKVIIIAISILSVTFAPIFTQPVSAEEEVITGTITIDDNTGATTVSDPPANSDSEHSSCLDENGNLIPDCGAIDYASEEDFENAVDNGLANEPEVVCADENEPDCAPKNPAAPEEGNEADNAEPETWPLILSLSALGATVVLVILINLFGRKK